MSQTQLLPVPDSNVLKNSFLKNREFPRDTLTLSQAFFKEFKSDKISHLLQSVTFGVVESSWFEQLEGCDKNDVLWTLRHLEDFLDALHRVTPDPLSTVTP